MEIYRIFKNEIKDRKMETTNNLTNKEITLKYLNILLIFVILLMMLCMVSSLSFKNSFELLTYIILALPCIGGVIAGFIGGGIRGVLGGIFVGALSFGIGPSIYIILSTIITSPDPASIILIVVLIPMLLAIGGIAGLLGGIIGVSIKKTLKNIKK